ncbi:MAG: hypothetical protein M0P47_09250 [Bacteroidales bacterium]|nr:hypothetical protein [Bacteroidales bacterium]
MFVRRKEFEKRVEEKLEDLCTQVYKLKDKVWLLEHPFKFKKGDKVRIIGEPDGGVAKIIGEYVVFESMVLSGICGAEKWYTLLDKEYNSHYRTEQYLIHSEEIKPDK